MKLWVPERGEAIWIDMDPQAGHEQRGRHPAMVLSPSQYNGKVGLALLCPITSHIKGYPFEVLLPDDHDLHGVVLSDQVKSLDWRARRAEVIRPLPQSVVKEVLSKLGTLLGAV